MVRESDEIAESCPPRVRGAELYGKGWPAGRLCDELHLPSHLGARARALEELNADVELMLLALGSTGMPGEETAAE